MKINFKKVAPLSLQILGIIFLFLIVIKLCFYFYYRFDNKLQGFTWQLVSISDKPESEEENKFVLKFKGIGEFRIIYNECGDCKFGYERGYLNTIYVNSYSIKKDCFITKFQMEYSSDLFNTLLDWKKYKIRNDSLWIITYEQKYAVFKKQDKK